MATTAKRKGPTAERAKANIQGLRKARGLELADLAERLSDLGQPIGVSGLSKLENGKRRVDVDDLMAIAIALDVTPNRLLLTPQADDEHVELVPEGRLPRAAAWRWACGEHELPDVWARKPGTINLGRSMRFGQENRPHDRGDDTPIAEMEEHRDVLRPVVDAVAEARDAGLSLAAVLSYIRMVDTLRGLGALARRKRGES